jgi:hypothetical protein
MFTNWSKYEGRKSVLDAACSGWSSSVTYIEVKEQPNQRVRDNRTISTDGNTSEI